MRARLEKLVLAGMLVCGCSFALNPALDISQYAHTPWRVREGFAKGMIWSVAQTPDGYLWAGTEFGLLRFDGIRFVQWTPPTGEHLPSDTILRLRVTRDGQLWIGTTLGLVSCKDGRLTHYPELDGQGILSIIEDHQGSVWVGASAVPYGKLCAIHNGRVHCDGQDGSFGFAVFSLLEYGGDLWAGAATGLWRWKQGSLERMQVPARPEIDDMIEGDNGKLWMATDLGMAQLVDDRAEPYTVQVNGRFAPYKFLRDREGGVWIATWGLGLVHFHQGRTDVFGSGDGLSSDYVMGLFEDREGNIWVATKDGLDRFRDYVVPTISFRQGLSGKFVDSVLAAREGSVWLATPDGLNRWDNGKITIYRKRGSDSHARAAARAGIREVYEDGLPDNVIHSLSQDSQGRIWVATGRGLAYFESGRFTPVSAVPTAPYQIETAIAGEIWINDYYRGLLHFVDAKFVEQISWAGLGRKDAALALAADPLQGGLWLGFFGGGLAYFKGGQIRASYAAADGLGKGVVANLRFDKEGALWAATEGGLSRLKNGRIETLTTKNGLPCDVVHWTVEDDAQVVWLGTSCGLLRVTRTDLDAWVADSHHVLSPRVFDNTDGVRSTPAAGGYTPRITKSPDGKLWFITYDGACVLDPVRLATNQLLPPVQIEQIIADRKTYTPSAESAALRLPAQVRDLEIDYAALSLVVPEKVRFRYKLEGRDNDWRDDAGNVRRAVYNDLPPRDYRFLVKACNNDGVWNEAGAALDFSIAPAYYQTRWFEAACVALFFTFLAGLYRYRLRQVAHQFNVRLEERVIERTRIARELHDTLLQSFQGLMLRFQAVDDVLPEGKAKEQLEQSLRRADQAIAEGRSAVYDLRSSTTIANDLANAVRALGDELATEDSAAFHLVVDGPARDLHPIIRDEIYRIAREALRNGFTHARAHHIETEITYGERAFRLRIRDDGQGIPPEMLEDGRPGHYGLPGMRERAKQAGGKLDIWSGTGAGTEIELSIPGSTAYRTSTRRSLFDLFRKKEGLTHDSRPIRR